MGRVQESELGRGTFSGEGVLGSQGLCVDGQSTRAEEGRQGVGLGAHKQEMRETEDSLCQELALGPLAGARLSSAPHQSQRPRQVALPLLTSIPHCPGGCYPLLPSSQGYFEDPGANQVGKYTINQAFALALWAAIRKESHKLL